MNKILHRIGDFIVLIAFLFLAYANIKFSVENSFDLGRVASVALVTILSFYLIAAWNKKFQNKSKNWVYYNKVIPCYLFLLSVVFAVFKYLFF